MTSPSSQAAHTLAKLFDQAVVAPARFEGPPPLAFEDTLTLLAHAHQAGHLEVEGPWRLSDTQARLLTRHSGHVPPGGWPGLMGLLTGTDLFALGSSGIAPEVDLVAFYQGWSEARLQVALTESLTCRLIPPSVAAGLFLLIGIHPAWGMRIAREIHDTLGLFGPPPGPQEDPLAQRFPNLELVSRAVFDLVAAVCEVVRLLRPHHCYDLGTFADLVWHLAKVTSHAIKALPTTPLQVSTHFGLLGELEDPHGRAKQFVRHDLFACFLEPLGAIEQVNAQQFVVWSERLPGDARVHHHGPLRGCDRLIEMLVGKSLAQVA